MMGMRWTNWLGLGMLVFFMFIHEPIWLLLGFGTTADSMEFDSTKILWAIPVVAYVIVAAVLVIRGGPPRDEK